jgi:hypothetical protein
MLLLIGGVITFFWVPGVPFDWSYFWQVGTGIGIAIAIGEIYIYRTSHGRQAASSELQHQ